MRGPTNKEASHQPVGRASSRALASYSMHECCSPLDGLIERTFKFSVVSTSSQCAQNERPLSMKPTHPRPLPGGEQASVRALSVPLLGGVRGGFMVPMHAQNERRLPCACRRPTTPQLLPRAQ